MMAPKGPKAPRSSSGLSSAPYTYSVFPFRGGRRSGNESDPVGAHGGLGGAPRRPGPPPDPQGEGPFRGSRELGAPLPTAPQGPGRPPPRPLGRLPPPSTLGCRTPLGPPPSTQGPGTPLPQTPGDPPSVQHCPHDPPPAPQGLAPPGPCPTPPPPYCGRPRPAPGSAPPAPAPVPSPGVAPPAQGGPPGSPHPLVPAAARWRSRSCGERAWGGGLAVWGAPRAKRGGGQGVPHSPLIQRFPLRAARLQG